MKVKYYLARPKLENGNVNPVETVVVANIHFQNRLMRISTGVSVLPKFWNSKSHRAKITPSYRQGSSINAILDQIKGETEGCYYDYKKDNKAEPSPATFRKLIDTALGRSKETKLNFFEYFTDFISRTKAGQRLTAKGKIISPSKAKVYGTTYNKLQDFNPKLDFDSIDLDFYNDFTAWLRKKGFAENNVGGHIQRIKAVLNEATEKGTNTNLAYRSKRFISVSEDVDNIALTVPELQDLQNLDLSGTPGLDRIRDLFLIGCYSGLRYSDFSRLTPANLQSGFIEITQLKTGNPVVIPIHSVVHSIIDKHGGNLPESISNQKTNEGLKEICQRVLSLQSPASKTRTQGGLRTTVNYQKWEIVSTHTARRTFATNAYLQGVPTVTIMAVTGHKTEKAFLKYIKVTPKEHAKIMAAIWNKNKMKIAN